VIGVLFLVLNIPLKELAELHLTEALDVKTRPRGFHIIRPVADTELALVSGPGPFLPSHPFHTHKLELICKVPI
jgi:hypothetical protein